MPPQIAPEPIFGTTLFDGEAARKGYQLNRMCFSLNQAANRAVFLADEGAYCDRYHLTPEQRRAVLARDLLGMIAAGGNVYYLAKLAGAHGLNMQDIGAMQTGRTVAGFKAMLKAQGRALTYAEAALAEPAHG